MDKLTPEGLHEIKIQQCKMDPYGGDCTQATADIFKLLNYITVLESEKQGLEGKVERLKAQLIGIAKDDKEREAFAEYLATVE